MYIIILYSLFEIETLSTVNCAVPCCRSVPAVNGMSSAIKSTVTRMADFQMKDYSIQIYIFLK